MSKAIEIWLKTPSKNRSVYDELSWDACGVNHNVRMYCAHVGNDGRLPKSKLMVALARRISPRRAADAVAELVDEEIWVEHDDCWELIDWLEDNPPVEAWTNPVKLERWQRDKRLKRNRELCAQIKQRDRNMCRYCGIRVDWGNRTGDVGGSVRMKSAKKRTACRSGVRNTSDTHAGSLTNDAMVKRP